VPAASPLIVVEEELPVVVTPPGERVTVHEPDGKPLNVTEPVATAHVGCVTVPTAGATGIGTALITIFDEATEAHPAEFLTEKV